MTPQEIKDVLSTYTGTGGYYRVSPSIPNVVATDGAIRMAELCGAYWLLDVIASHMPSVSAKECFCVARLCKRGKRWEFMLADDFPAEIIYATQTIEASDFPLDEIKLYVSRQGDGWVILLPSEY